MKNLDALIPGFGDTAKRAKIIQKIDDHVIRLGFTQAEADSIQDPRIILMAYRSMMYGNQFNDKSKSLIK